MLQTCELQTGEICVLRLHKFTLLCHHIPNLGCQMASDYAEFAQHIPWFAGEQGPMACGAPSTEWTRTECPVKLCCLLTFNWSYYHCPRELMCVSNCCHITRFTQFRAMCWRPSRSKCLSVRCIGSELDLPSGCRTVI